MEAIVASVLVALFVLALVVSTPADPEPGAVGQVEFGVADIERQAVDARKIPELHQEAAVAELAASLARPKGRAAPKKRVQPSHNGRVYRAGRLVLSGSITRAG